MAGGHGGSKGGSRGSSSSPGNPMNDVRWILGILLVFGIAWFMTGSANQSSNRNPLLKPPSPLDSGATYGNDPASGIRKNGVQITKPKPTGTNTSGSGTGQSTTPVTPGGVSGGTKPGTPTATSPLTDKITITDVNTTRSGVNQANREYIILENISEEGTSPILISGMAIESTVTGNRLIVPLGFKIPTPGAVGFGEAVFLKPGERAVITTGQSPNGLSFKTNRCTGYFTQFQNWTPSLYQNCPAIPESSLPTGSESLPDDCIRFLQSFPRCNVLEEMPEDFSSACSAFMAKEFNYNRCVEINKSLPDFLGKEWRLFVGRTELTWKEEFENIRLLDLNGKTVATYKY